jgi:hypothetical protein
MNDDEHNDPTDDELDRLLERFAAEQAGEVDEARVRAVLENVTTDHPLADEIHELTEAGASFSMRPAASPGEVELNLGFPDDPERYPKAHGRSVMVGRFSLAHLQQRPQG